MLLFELFNGARPDHLGIIPNFLNENDPDPAREQFNYHYSHGGGWRPFNGFTMNEDKSITYPDDPPLPLLAEAKFRNETIRIYPHAWVAIVQEDGEFEISRMD